MNAYLAVSRSSFMDIPQSERATAGSVAPPRGAPAPLSLKAAHGGGDVKQQRPPRKRVPKKKTKKKKAPKVEDDDGEDEGGDDDDEDGNSRERSVTEDDDDDDGGETEAPPARQPPKTSTKQKKKDTDDSKTAKRVPDKTPSAKKTKTKARQRKSKSATTTAAATAANAAPVEGFVVRDHKTGGFLELPIPPTQDGAVLLHDLFTLGNDAVDTPSGQKKQFTPAAQVATAASGGELVYSPSPARAVDLWPPNKMIITFDQQNAKKWDDTVAYSSGLPWTFDNPIRLPAAKEAIDIPLRTAFYGRQPELAALTGISSGLPTRNHVVVHDVTCLNAHSLNMHTDFQAVFCALKPVSLVRHYAKQTCYGRDAALDARMIAKVFKIHTPAHAPTTRDAKRVTKAMTETVSGGVSKDDSVSTAIAVTGDGDAQALQASLDLADTVAFSSATDKLVTFLQKHSMEKKKTLSSSSSSAKRGGGGGGKTKTAAEIDAHWDTRLSTTLDLNLYVSRYFWQDAFDSVYSAAIPLPFASKTKRDHFRAHPTIPVMSKPGGGSVVFMRVPSIGLRVPESQAHLTCPSRSMYSNTTLERMLALRTGTTVAHFDVTNNAIRNHISVDLNAEMVSALKDYERARQNVEVYIASCGSVMTEQEATTIRTRVNDYTRYRVVIDTRKDFERFPCWIAQYAYIKWKKLLQTEVARYGEALKQREGVVNSPSPAVPSSSSSSSSALSPPPLPTPTPVAAPTDGVALATEKDAVSSAAAALSTASMIPSDAAAPAASQSTAETQLYESLTAQAFVKEGPYVVISVRRDLLFEFAVVTCGVAQTELVDINTAHLTLFPHYPMDIVARDLTEEDKKKRPQLSMQVLVSYTHVSC